jgi:hypothetical protein
MVSAGLAYSQSVTLPPSGNNQRAAVTQHIGLVTVTVDYSSPHTVSPTGEDRRGKIWGKLVPYGMYDLGFNGRTGPWRAGANENTVFTVSHPVKIQGQALPAGRYGLHMIAGEKEWTIIFSKNSTSWGSFSYDPSEDALRVQATPAQAPFREWLSYEVVERRPDRATMALEWDELRVPFTIEVADPVGLYEANMRNELRDQAGFTWQGWNAAANYLLQQNRDLDLALKWAEMAVSSSNGIGQANFVTLSTRAQILDKLSRADEAKAVMAAALDLPGTTALEIHQVGRQLLAQGKKAEAMAVFQKNQKRFGDAWPIHVGLARAYSAMGDYKTALEHAQKALSQAPDDLNKNNLAGAVEKLKQGKDMNIGS